MEPGAIPRPYQRCLACSDGRTIAGLQSYGSFLLGFEVYGTQLHASEL